MLKTEAIKKFGSVRKLARELDLSCQAVYKWGENVPERRLIPIRDALAKIRAEKLYARKPHLKFGLD